jgi:DNA primase
MTEPINEFELVKSKVKIEDLIGAYISLKKCELYKEETCLEAACPFEACKEKNGSFVVKPISNMFYCFDCHQCGDHISFISTMEKLTPKDAFNFIITKYNLDIPYKN